jgi:hypothetical protein
VSDQALVGELNCFMCNEYSGFEKIVQQLRKEIELPSHFTLDACRHEGMTELEEAALTEGQGRALPRPVLMPKSKTKNSAKNPGITSV